MSHLRVAVVRVVLNLLPIELLLLLIELLLLLLR